MNKSIASTMSIVTCIAPVNIAVIKYWGKRDEELILPVNDSISSSLSIDFMHSKTTISASPTFTKNRIWLNGKEESFENPRLVNCLRELKKRATSQNENSKWFIHICSENNFPTAAGLASSAAGYACLVYALTNLYGIQDDISALARLGSGSACRSVFGGWVQWHAGLKNDGSDSIATQVASPLHWPQMRILILVVSDHRKKYSSTFGMRQSVLTSEFLKYRAEVIVPIRIQKMIEAINEKNFQNFATLTMQDSNQFHSVCLDTLPPCTYMNDASHSIIHLIHAYNDLKGSTKVAYTFDAGPNACLYLLEDDVPEVLSMVKSVFPCSPDNLEYVKGMSFNETPISEDLKKVVDIHKQDPGSLKYMVLTKVGEGPKVLIGPDVHLLNEKGVPKRLI